MKSPRHQIRTQIRRTENRFRTLGFAALTFCATLFPFSIAMAGEFQEKATCESTAADAAFPRISIQADPANANRAILILYASDGWTQVYSGPMKQTSKAISFSEDKKTIQASFDKFAYTARITFNSDLYRCDERSFGN